MQLCGLGIGQDLAGDLSPRSLHPLTASPGPQGEPFSPQGIGQLQSLHGFPLNLDIWEEVRNYPSVPYLWIGAWGQTRGARSPRPQRRSTVEVALGPRFPDSQSSMPPVHCCVPNNKWGGCQGESSIVWGSHSRTLAWEQGEPRPVLCRPPCV